jgi:hypothetical protein
VEKRLRRRRAEARVKKDEAVAEYRVKRLRPASRLGRIYLNARPYSSA